MAKSLENKPNMGSRSIIPSFQRNFYFPAYI
jgi:hypothetical protein